MKQNISIIGFCGTKQSGKNTCTKIWQLLDVYHNFFTKHEIEEIGNDAITYVLKELENPIGLDLANSVWEHHFFSKPLKEIVCILTGCSMQDLENEDFKNKLVPEHWVTWKLYKTTADRNIDRYSMIFNTEDEARKKLKQQSMYFNNVSIKPYHPTYRQFMRYVGTELFIEQLHANWAVNILFKDYKPLKYEGSGDNINEASQNAKPVYPKWILSDVRFKEHEEVIRKYGGIIISVQLLSDSMEVDAHRSETEVSEIKVDYTISARKGDIESLILQIYDIMKELNIIRNV